MILPEIDLSTTAIVDFETYYDKEYSLKTMGTVPYVHDERFDPYLVSIVGPDFEWVGNPEEYDWGQLDGYALGAHNASFDQYIVDFRGYCKYRDFYCTADLSCFLQAPRYLAGAAKALLGKRVLKTVRSDALGKHWPQDFTPEQRKAMLEYALEDSRLSRAILVNHLSEWPEHERKLSRITRMMGWGGVPVNSEDLEESLETVNRAAWELRESLPWVGEIDIVKKTPYKPLSPRALAVWCGKEGVPPPRSVAVDDPRYHAWAAQYENRIPWVRSMQKFRSANAHAKKIQAMIDRTLSGKDGDTRMPYGLKYYGAATTARWSGDSGFNTQNITKAELFGVNLRQRIRCPEGKVVGLIDLSNIEPRCLMFLVDDTALIDLVKRGIDIYEAHSRLTMGYDDPRPLKRPDDDPEKARWGKFRDLAKVRVLQLGYGSGWHKLYLSARDYEQLALFEDPVTAADKSEFVEFVNTYNQPLVPTIKALDEQGWLHSINAFKQVQDYRQTNPKITGLWREMDAAYKASIGGDFMVELPSGRAMRYMNVRPAKDGVVCQTERGGPFLHFYGAKFVENLCQAVARDVFAEGLLRVHEELGILPCLQVHDELVVEADSVDQCHEICQKAVALISQTPEWLGDTPLAADYQVSPYYTK